MKKNLFKDKILLITGGTGSFGQAVLERFLKTDVGEIRIFSRDEKKQEDLRNKFKNDKLRFYIGDVKNRESLRNALKGVDYVFHAAALKQVPSCEFHPSEAVQTNIIGTENVLSVAEDNGVKKVIVLSTDKAVYPINAMGISKAMAEKIMVAKARQSNTIFCATRYGNVMASRGSVIPLFVSQIIKNIPITLTDPKMTRFLMSLEESVELVLFAFENGNKGDIFVQKSDASSVGDLAQALKEIFNRTDLETRIIGTRHGEKLFETLVSREELSHAKDLKKFFRISADNRDMNYSKYESRGSKNIELEFDYTSHDANQLNITELKNLLRGLDYIRDKINA